MEELQKQHPVYTISTAAEILGISIHTLRMYEREGLILPHKKESGHRLYSTEDIDRIQCIRNAINENKISIAGIKTIYSLIPCWKLIDCPVEKRDKCPAITSHSDPCWTYKHSKDACSKNECRTCVIYKGYSEYSKIKELIRQC